MDNVTYTYHWLDYYDFAPIRHGEAGSTYTVQSSDVGKRILLAVSFTDDAVMRKMCKVRLPTPLYR